MYGLTSSGSVEGVSGQDKLPGDEPFRKKTQEFFLVKPGTGCPKARLELDALNLLTLAFQFIEKAGQMGKRSLGAR